jgi:hypothetical protein
MLLWAILESYSKFEVILGLMKNLNYASRLRLSLGIQSVRELC